MVAARIGAAAQAVKTRARALQGVAVDAGDGCTGGSGLRLARAVTTDTDDGGSGGSRLRQQGLSEDWGGEEMR